MKQITPTNPITKVLKLLTLTVVVMIGTIQSPNRVQAADDVANNLDEAAVMCAKKIAYIVNQHAFGQKEVWVRSFSGAAVSNVDVPRAIQEKLPAQGITPKTQAKIEVDGRITRNPADELKDMVGYKIQGNVHIPGIDEPKTFTVTVNNAKQAAVYLLPTSNNIPGSGSGSGGSGAVATVWVEGGTELRSSKDSPFGLEILKRDEKGTIRGPKGKMYKVLPITIDGNVPRVKGLEIGDVYAVRIHNRKPDYDVVAGVYIDGLSMFAFAKDPKQQQFPGWLVNKKDDQTIFGYFYDTEEVHSFLVGGYDDVKVAKQLPTPKDIGSIAVSFYLAWDLSEEKQPGGAPISSLPKITNPGERVQQSTKIVNRKIDDKWTTILRVHY